MYSIGEIISTYRKKKGLLQQDLADELAKEGITISYKAISNWERNLAEPSPPSAFKSRSRLPPINQSTSFRIRTSFRH